MAEPELFAIDTFAVFGRTLLLRGWAADSAGIASALLRIGSREIPLPSYGQIDSADVVAQVGAVAAGSRFEELIPIDTAQEDVMAAELVLVCRNAQRRDVRHLGFPRGQSAVELTTLFKSIIREMPKGALLEIGSRGAAGAGRDLVPVGWSYLGMDIEAGPNVDVVGDAHELSGLFPTRRFDAAIGFSVLEHLLMPWKFAVELNRVLNVGAVGVITTHQAWPLQEDLPGDFWRLSDRSWDALFNRATGFEVIQAQMGEPTYFVAQRCHAITNFGMTNIGYLASNVVFRKVAETSLRWPVRVSDVTGAPHPAA